MRKAHQNYINKLLDIGDDVPGENTKRSITKRFLQYIKAKRKAQGGGGGTAIYGPHRYAPLWRVWFSSSLL